MPRRKKLFSTRRRKRSTAESSAAIAYAVLFLFAIALVQILLPFLIIGALIWGAFKVLQYVNQQQKQATLTSQQRQEKLNTILYQLIQTHQGRVSILDFAMQAHISSDQAKAYLDSKAVEFTANFEATDTGDVLYIFPSSLNAQVQPPSIDLPPVALPTPTIDRQTALNQADLARRFDLSSSAVSRKKFSPDFAQWSQDRDPQGWAWRYDSDQKLFYPQK